ncbi:U3 small nucleolar RNA-associated protein 6 -like, partial [Asbolus verrucosus]
LILKARKEFEYKINGVSKSLEDFKEYILYEKILLKQVYSRRDKSMISERKTTSVAVQNMIKNCSQNPEVWQVAAAWYANDRNDLNAALKIVNKGLTIHKNSKLLYTEAIKLELSAIKGNNRLEDDEEAQRKVCKKIETYVLFICDCINDSNYLIEILNLLATYSFTTSVQNLLIDKLLQNHSDMEFVWHTLAQREKREEASNDKYLTERYYIKWLELVTDEEALRILERDG